MAHPRARSFGGAAADYAQYRPEYPAAALDWALAPLPERTDRTLLDLAAGTGKLTAALLGLGTVIAVEPDPAMLDELRARFPGTDAREGSAEEIPLPDASVDAVLVGQAFHWFDHQAALPQIARVLRTGGVLASLWNGDDTRVDWVRGLHEAGAWRAPVAYTGDIPPRLPPHGSFTGEEAAAFPNPVPTTVDTLIATYATHSWALTSEPAERDAAFARMRAYLAARPETSDGEFELPLVTDVMRALRK